MACEGSSPTVDYKVLPQPTILSQHTMNWLLLSCLTILLAIFVALWHTSFKRYAPPIRSDVLLVFAHPDDEAMFFSPLLMYLKRINVRAHFLCLSNGNFGGLGVVREKELVASAAYYGLNASDVTTINDERLPDGMGAAWDPSLIAQMVRHTIASNESIRTVITFDKHGVSSHPNHISVHEGVKLLAKQQAAEVQRPLLFLQLHTRSLLAKYAGPLSLVPYFLGVGTVHPNAADSKKRQGVPTSKYAGGGYELPWAILAKPAQALSSLEGLQRHKSQLLWFRYLFVFLSSYGYVNEFDQIE